jgi:exodeoxyribonuclease-5
MELTPKQENAIKLAKEWDKSNNEKPFVIMGIAGSGKSTLVQFIIEALNIPEEKVAFVTFTGKAASVLTRKKCNACTIHKFFYDIVEDSKTKKISFKKKEKISDSVELIVIDEFYMVTEEMMNDILSFNKKVIALGDNFQLPPVMSKPNKLDKNPDVYLDEPLRQSLDNPIIYLANRAKNHQRIDFGSYGDNVIVVPNNQLNDEYFLMDQIIVGKNKTAQKFNNFYRKKFFNTTQPLPVKNEKLICLRNNWNLFTTENNVGVNLVNGITGYIDEDMNEMSCYDHLSATRINFRPEFFDESKFKSVLTDTLMFKERLCTDKDLDNEKYADIMKKRWAYNKFEINGFVNIFNFGYAISCYKSQGSEFNSVFFVQETLSKSSYWSHLYTGITRASEKLVLTFY